MTSLLSLASSTRNVSLCMPRLWLIRLWHEGTVPSCKNRRNSAMHVSRFVHTRRAASRGTARLPCERTFNARVILQVFSSDGVYQARFDLPLHMHYVVVHIFMRRSVIFQSVNSNPVPHAVFFSRHFLVVHFSAPHVMPIKADGCRCNHGLDVR